MASGSEKTVVAVPESRLRPEACAFFGSPDPGNGKSLLRGSVEVRLLPFIPQPAYDRLLWASDWNFVRGEDSFVRAQWAQRPLAWQIYPQKENAHRLKLDAFLDLYCAGMDRTVSETLRQLWRAWNSAGEGGPDIGELWGAIRGHKTVLRTQSAAWTAKLAAVGNLAGNLAQYCEERLK